MSNETRNRSHWTRFAALALVLGASCAPAAVTPPAPAAPDQASIPIGEAASRLAGNLFIRGRAMDDLRDLMKSIGERPTGSERYTRAKDWAMSRFQAYLIRTNIERLTLPQSWRRGAARGRIMSPEEREVRVISAGYAPSTPAGGVRGEVILLSDLSPESIRSRAAELRGRIALLDRPAIFKDGFSKGTARISQAYEPLRDAGVAAVLFTSPAQRGVKVFSHFYSGGLIAPLPVLTMHREDVERLRADLSRGPVTMELSAENQVGGPVEVASVIGYIPGREDPDSWVLVGAHLDTWDGVPGAQDNGSGVVQVLDAARAIASLGVAPRRSIRFALWAAEEQGIRGSSAYADAHAKELSKCVAVINTDEGAGEPLGYAVDGREDVALALKPLSESLLASLGGDQIVTEIAGNSDHTPFWLRGVPTLNLAVDTSHYFDVHHLPSDTLDKVKPHPVAAGAAILAVTAWALADRSESFAPRLNRADVEALLRKKDLLDAYRANGYWR